MVVRPSLVDSSEVISATTCGPPQTGSGTRGDTAGFWCEVGGDGTASGAG